MATNPLKGGHPWWRVARVVAGTASPSPTSSRSAPASAEEAPSRRAARARREAREEETIFSVFFFFLTTTTTRLLLQSAGASVSGQLQSAVSWSFRQLRRGCGSGGAAVAAQARL
jgi:hypothetical protein